jgi:hypothetical protein
MKNTLLTTFRQALNTHDEALLNHVFDACSHHLGTLLEAQDFSAMGVLTQAIEAECKAYLTNAKAQQTMGLRLLKHVHLHRDHVAKIQNSVVAKAFAGKISRADAFNTNWFLMSEFTRQKRPSCCDDIYTPLELNQHLEHGDKKLKQVFMLLMVAHFEAKTSPPDFWIEKAREHQQALLEAIELNPYEVGADFVLAADHFGMSTFRDALLPQIITAPKNGDYAHLLKLELLGKRFGGLLKKQIFVEAQRVAPGSVAPNPTPLPERQRARTLIIAIQVFDFYKSGDYLLTSGDPKGKEMRSWLAESASFIWTQDKEARGDELLALLNRDFNELSLAKGVEDFFDEDLYRHLEVTRADALESDLGL